MQIGILDDYQHCVMALDCYGKLRGHQTKTFTNSARGIGQLAIRLRNFDALVSVDERTHFSKALLEKLPNLKLISHVGDTLDHIDITAATKCGIAIAQTTFDPVAPAELTWALIMAASRRIPQYASHLKNGTWQTVALSSPHNLPGTGLKGRTLGIWGYGNVGRLVAQYGKAFGMHVTVWGSDASCAAAQADGFDTAISRDCFFAESDVVTLHLRLNDATRGIVTAEDFARMKTDALFVNTSNAELVACDALIPALQQGRPAYAALDVFDTEPLAPNSQLLRMPNVLATPHIGFVEKNNYEKAFGMAFQSIIDFANGNTQRILNPEALGQA